MGILKNRSQATKSQRHKIFIVTCGFLVCGLFCGNVFAQEIPSQGWTASEPRQRSSSTLSLAVTESVHDPARPSSGTFVPATVQKGTVEDRMLPFPVLMPKAIVYPRKAVRKGWEGRTVVATEVLADGSVGRTALAKSSGHEILDHAAQEAVKTWKFGFESNQCDAPPQYVDIPVTFKLEEQ